MNCHPHCGACCIALSISSPLPNMPKGKQAGERCVNLGEDLRCKVYEIRPKVCRDFMASEFCGASHTDALKLLGELERQTSVSHASIPAPADVKAPAPHQSRS